MTENTSTPTQPSAQTTTDVQDGPAGAKAPRQTLAQQAFIALSAAYQFVLAIDTQNAVANLKDEVKERPLTKLLRETAQAIARAEDAAYAAGEQEPVT